MSVFKDGQDRQWNVNVTVASVKRVIDLLDIDLLDVPINGDLFARLRTNDVLLCDVLYVLCKPEADVIEVTSEDFGGALAGESITRAEEAFWGSLTDFFRGPRKALLSKMLEGQKQIESERVKLLRESLTDEQIEKLVADDVNRLREEVNQRLAIHGGSSGNSPESLELTQDLSRSAS